MFLKLYNVMIVVHLLSINHRQLQFNIYMRFYWIADIARIAYNIDSLFPYREWTIVVPGHYYFL